MTDSGKAVFLSYATQDTEAVMKICDALRAAGVEVWFDQNELVGGDAWDQKIRRQIKECALFVPVISANTNARAEGYFRLEWKLAVDRSHLMADDAPFLFPVVIDDTTDGAARVPDKFRDVQWTRLSVKDTPGTLASRVAKLLGGAVHSGSREAFAGGETPARSATTRGPHWLRIVSVVGGLAIGLVYALRPMWSPPRRVETQPSVASATSPALSPSKGLSEARQLTARARAMTLDKYDSTAEDFAAAESLVKKALELDPNDAEIWAFSSLLNASFGSRGFDHAAARVAAARSQAERALSLDPDSLEGLFALGRWQRDNEDAAVTETTFKKILARQPDRADALSQLATIYERMGRLDEAVALYERSATVPGGFPALSRYLEYLLYFNRAQFEEADRCIRQSVATQPSANSQAGLAMLLLTWKGDADGAARVLASGPTAVRSEPRTIWITAMVQLDQRAPEEALKTLERFSDDYIQDNWFAGPKTYWTGRAHALAGRKEAARLAWETALAVVDARLKTTPQSLGLHLMRGEMLAWLGRADEALREAHTVAELTRSDRSAWFNSEARIYAVLGRADDALPLLEKFRAAPVGQIVGWPLTPALLRLDPLWDKIRDDPRFQALCAERKKETAGAGASPRDWPHDPELKRAVALLDGFDAIPEDFKLAEEIAQRALEKSPMDPETATVMARVQSTWLSRNWDRSEARFARAKSAVERAAQLAPGEPEALAALGAWLWNRNAELGRARELLERAIALAPAQPRFHRLRDNILFSSRDVPREEAFASAERTAALFPRDPLVHYELSIHYRDAARWAEFEKETDATIALAPVANAIVWKARTEFFLHSDLAAMKAQVDRVPPRVRAIERTVTTYFLHAAFSGQLQDGLDALRAFPEPWMRDGSTNAPKGLFTGALLELAGKPGLARLEYEAALAEIKRHEAAEPTNPVLRQSEAWSLHGLGRDDEARAAFRIYFETLRRPHREIAVTFWWFDAIPWHLLTGDRATAGQLIREAAGTPDSRDTVRQRLKFDPRMAPWRADPEIVALLAAPAGAEPKK